MARDPLVEEVRRVREKHAKRFDYDLDAIFEDLKAQERATGRKFVRLSARRKKSPPEEEGTTRRGT